MYFVYILLCADQTYYVGFTNSLKNRITQHNNGLVEYTKYRLPIKVKQIGIFPSKKRAVEYEQYLKTGSGNAMFKKRLV